MSDLTKYKELLQQARTKNDEVSRAVAGQFVPQLYAELRTQDYSPKLARTKIVEDCVPMWAQSTILDLLPPEAKDGVRAEAGRNSAEKRKERRQSEKKYKVLLNHVAITQIHEAIIASTDGNVWIYLNAKHDYASAEPVTQKSVTTEPLTVKSASYAPVRS
jgi:hypothetical protein